MKSIFNYDNKFMQLLQTLGDLIILNFLFLLCCVPIFTIGAAQAGLYTGLRKLTDKEDDSSPAAAFMKGFRDGFTKITPAFLIMLVLLAATALTASSAAFYKMNGMKGAPVILAVVGLCICAVFQTLISVFHSRFSCTVWQLFRNAWFTFLAHPLRSILATLLTWSPIILFFGDLRIFILLTPLFLSVYFSFMYLLVNNVMRKPFDGIIQIFNERQSAAEEQTETEEQTQTEA